MKYFYFLLKFIIPHTFESVKGKNGRREPF